MDYVTCTGCNGRKKVIGLGCIEKNCDGCNGVGYVEKSPDYIVDPNPVTGAFTAEFNDNGDITSTSFVMNDPTLTGISLSEADRKAELDKLIKKADKEEKKRVTKAKKKPKKKYTTRRLSGEI